jgi:hypothetical protein
MPGVEVTSTAITHLLAGDGILRNKSVRLADGIIAVLLPMILVTLLAWRRSAVGLIAMLIVVLTFATANVLVFRRNRATGDFIRRRAALVGQAARAVFRHANHTARTISGA